MKPHRAAQAVAVLEFRNPSPFERAFQSTKHFWNTSLQRKEQLSGSVFWAVIGKERFCELIEDLRISLKTGPESLRLWVTLVRRD